MSFNNNNLNYYEENQTLIYIDDSSTICISCKINNIKTIINFKMEICYSLNNINRYWNKIYISRNSNKLNILILLQNPSDDKNTGTLEKLIKKFIEDEKYIDKIYTITFINVYSKIDKYINSWKKLNFNNEILTNEEKLNINAIKILLLIEKYDECYIGSGQHCCKQGKQIKEYFLMTYVNIVNIILNKITIIKGFGNFTKFHTPSYPYSKKNKNKPIFIDIPIDLLRDETNRLGGPVNSKCCNSLLRVIS